jgi:O-antigen ligase
MARIQAAVIGLTALILTPGALFYFDVTSKLAVLLIGAAVLCLAPARTIDPKFTALLGLSLASAALSTALSSNAALSLYGSTWRRYGLIAHAAVLVVAWSIHQAPDRMAVARWVSAAGALSAVYGTAQYFGFDPILPAAAYHVGEGIWTIVRPPGTLGYVSYFATWLLVCGFLGLSWRGRAGWAIAALCWTAMLLTGTRAAILGLAAGWAVWLYRSGFRVPRRAIVAAGLVAAGAAFYWSPAGWNLRSRARWYREDPWGGARPLLWRDSARMAARHPAAGHGPETFQPEFARAESEELARAYPDFAHESPHNVFLDAMVSQGMPGLLCFAALCVVGWRAADPRIAGAFAAGLAAQQFTVFTIPTALLFYGVVAIASEKPSRAVRLPRLAMAPVAAVFVLFAVRAVAADRALATSPRGRELAAAARSVEEPFNTWYQQAVARAAQGDAAGTEAALRNAIAAKPNWFKPHWMLAKLLALRGLHDEALAEARTAARLNGGKNPEVAATLVWLAAEAR